MSSASVRNGESHLAADHVEQTRIARVHAAMTETRRVQDMRIPILLRGALVALIALFGVGLQNANADSGSITLTIYKGGWIIGGSAGGARSPSAAAAMAWSWRHRLRPFVWRIEDGTARSSAQHPTRVGCCWRLRRGRRGACGRGRRPRYRAHQPARRHSGALRPAGRADGER